MKDKSIKVLYISSWNVGVKEGQVSFIFEQIDILQNYIESAYVDIKFESYFKNFLDKDLNKLKIQESLWNNTKHFTYRCGKFSTRFTQRSLLKEYKIVARKIAFELKKTFDPDIIHAHVVLPAGLVAVSVGNVLGIPAIIQEHSAPFDMHLNTAEKRKLVPEIFNKAAKIIAVGPELKSQLIQYVDDKKIEIIPEMLNTRLFIPKSENKINGKIRLISVGGLVKRKAYDLSIDVIKQLINEGVDAELTIIGEGPDRKRIEELIRKSKLNGTIYLVGHVHRNDLGDYYRNSNIYIHTSEKETFGIAPAEALLCGIPVVTVKCNGPEYYISSKVGIVTKNRNVREIAKAVKEVSYKLKEFDPNYLNQFIVKRFGENQFTNRIIKIYKSLLV